ncbi:MAG: hypothetical protein HRT61_23055, partial [Ekhidna sp.]|nr:hypothetical protein [Ekhidna sp.]
FNGSYQVIARATSIIGPGLDTATLVIDQNPPIVTVDSQISNVRSPRINGSVDDITATVTVVVESSEYVALVDDENNRWRLPVGRIQPPLADGTYDIQVFAENRFGIGTDTTTNELRLDATAPEIFVDNIGTSIVNPELTGFISDISASIVVTVEGRGEFTPEVNQAENTWSIPAGSFDPPFEEREQPYSITATAEDSVGNIGTGTGELVIANSIIALQASRVTSNSFRANWSDVPDAQNYLLEVSENDDFSTLLTSQNTTETSFEIENLDFESTYFYRTTYDNGVDAPTTSNVVTVNTLITPETLDDFNSLAIIESSTGGSNWTNPSNWNEETRKQDWDFIILENERIVEVNIPDNNLTGRFPFTPLMTALRTIDVSGNSLIDVDDITRLRSIEEVNLNNNLLEFDDLEKLSGINSFSYSSQKTRYAFDQTAIADSVLIRVFNDTSLSITAGGEFLNYTWYRRNVEIATNNDFSVEDSVLQIKSLDFDNMGLFSAEVGNDILPDLTIPVDPMFVLAIADFSVDVNDENGELIPDNVDGFLLLTEQRGFGFDTLSTAINQPSAFTFTDVILGDYLISIDSDREKYVPTYYADAFEWTEADTVMFRKDTAFQLSMTIIPPPLDENSGDGSLDVIIEEDFDGPEGRIDARRRAAKRKCGLRRKRSGGRTGQDDDEFELIAYGETDDNGEFKFGFLPVGTYRFFVEYPGIPIDESSFVEFEVGETGISDTDFKLEAFASPDGISVEIEKILGVIF